MGDRHSVRFDNFLIGVKDGAKELADIHKIILFEIQPNPFITTNELAQKK